MENSLLWKTDGPSDLQWAFSQNPLKIQTIKTSVA